MKAVIGQDQQRIEKTQKNYINDILIYSDSEDEEFYNKEVGKGNLFKKFLDTDYRANFKEYNDNCNNNDNETHDHHSLENLENFVQQEQQRIQKEVASRLTQ